MAFWENIFTDAAEYHRFLEGFLGYDGQRWDQYPRVASLMLTHHCNIRCCYCPFPASANKPKMQPVGKWIYLIEQLAGCGIHRISFSGGEPLLYPSLVDLVQKASETGVTKGIVTNGIRLTPEKISCLINAGLDALTISLDTVDADLYARICGVSPGALSSLLEILITVKEKQQCWVGINTIISRRNVHRLSPLLGFSRRYEIPIQFQVFNPFPGVKDIRPSSSRLRGAINFIRKEKARGTPVQNSDAYLEAMLNFVKSGTFPPKMNCLVPFVEMVVTPDLKIKACCTSTEVGDARNNHPLTVWKHPEFHRWRLRAKGKVCRDCFLIYHDQVEGDCQW